MKIKHIFLGIGLLATAGGGLSSCTDLEEKVYDQVTSQNYYQTKDDVIHAVFRPFEHTYYSMWQVHEHEELPADQLVTVVRGDWWWDGGKWIMYHRHQYDGIQYNNPGSGEWTSEWELMYQAIGQCNLVLDDLAELNPATFKITDTEWASYIAQLRCMRAFCYLRLINCYRNCLLVTTSDASVSMQPENRKQVEPRVLFEFIESELKDFCLTNLPPRSGNYDGPMQGQFTQGAAAALLARLYLNAEKWIGEARWDDCIGICERIRKGEFGHYELAERWDAPFDWNNETCSEVIFAFTASFATTCHHMANSRQTVYGRMLPYQCGPYLGIEKDGERNPRYCITPSYDNSYPNRQLFDYKLGQVSQKFLKYPGDLRWKQYKNTSNNTREGMMFLEGKIPNNTQSEGFGKSPQGYTIYLRDQVGQFFVGGESGQITGSDAESKCENGDFNSGLFVVKYPFYPYEGGAYKESDHAVIRLAEVYYTEAECYLRKGDARTAGSLLNKVRERNYSSFGDNIAYEPEGRVKLDMDEMLDEWGREFLAESRRRTDLIRFGRFQEAWWDKKADADTHYELFPLSQDQLEQNLYLKQNPGYPDITR